MPKCNWKLLVRSILPEQLKFGGFEQCGHIIHVNLREELLPYKNELAKILLDNVPNARTVVNKLDMLNSEFRVMDFELLAGDPDYLTVMVEHGIRYKLDYSKAFWNSRLSTVHQQTIEKFDKNSVVFDAFAGVGPFILPAVKKQRVRKAYANDLNPAAIDFLQQSMKLNKIPVERVETFVMDAGKFIQEEMPAKIASYFQAEVANGEEAEDNDEEQELPVNFHVVMNLPGHSADFLPYFYGLLAQFPEIRPKFEHCPFWIHCHFFIKGHDDLPRKWYEQEARQIIQTKFGIPDLEIQELNFNRKVASRKDMFCARIRLPPWVAFEKRAAEGKQLEQQQQQSITGQSSLSDNFGHKRFKYDLSTYRSNELDVV